MLVNPEKLIDIPEPSDDEGEFVIDVIVQPAEPMENWLEFLEGMAYPTQTITITDQDISGVERRELDGQGWHTTESAPSDVAAGEIHLSRPDLEEAIKSELLLMSERLLEQAGHSSQFKGHMYAVLLKHARSKFLDGASLGLAEEHLLDTAWRMLPKVEEIIGKAPGLVEGMVKYANQ